MNDSELISNYWHYGCLRNELNNEGDFLLFKIADSEVVLYHDGINIIAFDNLCPHRGKRFFNEKSGNKLAICQYHGWSYSRGVVRIHSFNDFEGDPCNIKLNNYKIEFCGNLLFFCISPNRLLIDQLGSELYEILESLSFDISLKEDHNSYVFECFWPIAIENALEPSHVPFVHKNTLASLGLTNMKNKFWNENSGVYFDISNHRVVSGFSRMKKYFNLSGHVHEGYMSIYLYPFGFISSTWGSTYSIQNFFPKNDNETWFDSRLYSVHATSLVGEQINKNIISAAADVNRDIFQEDHEICKLVSRNYWCKNLDGPLYNDEVKIKHFRRSIAKYL